MSLLYTNTTERFNSRTPGGVRHCLISVVVSCFCVSIHAPREGCDLSSKLLYATRARFQFTHPGRGATFIALARSLYMPMFQFTHPGRGATFFSTTEKSLCEVSIHAPREGCDSVQRGYGALIERFNSRTPGGVRLAGSSFFFRLMSVSIHAPREGCDV